MISASVWYTREFWVPRSPRKVEHLLYKPATIYTYLNNSLFYMKLKRKKKHQKMTGIKISYFYSVMKWKMKDSEEFEWDQNKTYSIGTNS